MLKDTAIYSRSSVRLLLGISLGIFLVALTLSFLRKPHGDEQSEKHAVAATSPNVMPQLHGAEAAEYLEAKGELQSLAKAVVQESRVQPGVCVDAVLRLSASRS